MTRELTSCAFIRPLNQMSRETRRHLQGRRPILVRPVAKVKMVRTSCDSTGSATVPLQRRWFCGGAGVDLILWLGAGCEQRTYRTGRLRACAI